MYLLFFIKNATTKYGPLDFVVSLGPNESIAQAVDKYADYIGVVICHDYRSAGITKEQAIAMSNLLNLKVDKILALAKESNESLIA